MSVDESARGHSSHFPVQEHRLSHKPMNEERLSSFLMPKMPDPRSTIIHEDLQFVPASLLLRKTTRIAVYLHRVRIASRNLPQITYPAMTPRLAFWALFAKADAIGATSRTQAKTMNSLPSLLPRKYRRNIGTRTKAQKAKLTIVCSASNTPRSE